MTTNEADAAYWQGRNVGILVGAARATADAEEERLALVARAERAEGVIERVREEIPPLMLNKFVDRGYVHAMLIRALNETRETA